MREISVVDAVSGHGAGNTCGVSSVLVNCLVQSNEVSLALAHLLPFDVDVAITVVASGPKLLVLPDCGVVEEGHCQVVFYQVFG